MALSLQPADCVVLEDSLSGIQSAQSAGIGYIVAIRSNDEHPGPIQLDGVDQFIDNLGSLDWQDLFIKSELG
jgi:beta-phosphoglucomutase-like phosphatase (HAD superfamily)